MIMFSVHGLLHTVAQVASCMRVSGQGISRNVHPSSWMLWSRLCLLEGKGPLFLVDSCVVAVPFTDSDSLQQTLQSAKGTLKLCLSSISASWVVCLFIPPPPPLLCILKQSLGTPFVLTTDLILGLAWAGGWMGKYLPSSLLFALGLRSRP